MNYFIGIKSVSSYHFTPWLHLFDLVTTALTRSLFGNSFINLSKMS